MDSPKLPATPVEDPGEGVGATVGVSFCGEGVGPGGGGREDEDRCGWEVGARGGRRDRWEEEEVMESVCEARAIDATGGGGEEGRRGKVMEFEICSQSKGGGGGWEEEPRSSQPCSSPLVGAPVKRV